MKIGIIGAGALGLMFGSLLSLHHDVHLIDVSQEMIDTINKEGVVVEDDQLKTKKVYYPHAHLNGTLDEVMDVVFVLVKSNYTLDCLKANMNLITDKTYFITLQNGLGNDEKMLQFIPKDHLLIGVTRINSRRLGLNAVARANHSISVIGYDENTKDIAERIVSAFNEATFDACLEANIQKVVWDKLFLNLATNALTSIFDCSIGAIYQNNEALNMAQEAVREAVRVANSLGLHYDEEAILELNRKFCVGMNSGYPSMWQDVKAKRKTEIHALNGKISELGKLCGVKTPTNDLITKKILEIENNY